jgi:mono/diheme cytochrome c family protein
MSGDCFGKGEDAMKRTIGFTLSVVATVLLLAAFYSGPAAGQEKKTLDGKEIFLAQKCNLCHSVSTAGIEKTTKSEKMAGPDLAKAEKRDATVIAKYLRKSADLNGKKHVKAFTGSDEEIGAMVAWLQKQQEMKK